MKDIKSVTLVFENCEDMKMDTNNIRVFMIDDIHTVVKRVACNSISEYDYTGKIVMEIGKRANISNNKLFKRIMSYNDITSIVLEYSDNTSKSYYVKWVGDSNYSNDIQQSEITPNGDLRLFIMENCNKDDYFGDEDSVDIDFEYSMIDNEHDEEFDAFEDEDENSDSDYHALGFDDDYNEFYFNNNDDYCD